jgi:hypothetical protein
LSTADYEIGETYAYIVINVLVTHLSFFVHWITTTECIRTSLQQNNRHFHGGYRRRPWLWYDVRGHEASNA